MRESSFLSKLRATGISTAQAEVVRNHRKAAMGRRPHSSSPHDHETCRFCEIVSGNAEARIVFEDSLSVAFLDEKPLFEGHCLLIPRVHYQTLLDLPRDLVGPLFLNAQHLAAAVENAMKAEGTFVAINNIVSQSVPHFHIHVVPRRKGDGLRGFFWPRRRYRSQEELLAAQKVLSAYLR
jgi:histidine triad (HIT) family protein